MATHHHIPDFTATDIEKYHKGLLSPAEMNRLEKAALDDPFLADALEGYATPGIDMQADLAELKERLAQKKEDKKVIPLAPAGKSIPWLRAAAIIILVSGLGFLTYRFAFTDKKDSDIAQQLPTTPQSTEKDRADNTTTAATDTPATAITPAPVTTDQNKQVTADGNTASVPAPVAIPKTTPVNRGTEPVEVNAFAAEKKKTAAPSSVDPVPSGEVAQNQTKEITQSAPVRSNEYAAKAQTDSARFRQQENAAAADLATIDQQRRLGNSDAKGETRSKAYLQNNIYRGQVLDNQNNPLPFANVTNVRDNVGTYSDAQGYFVLTSPDSVLNVQVRSLGFKNTAVPLQRDVANNAVRLQDDRSDISAIVVSRKKVNSSRARNSTVVLDEPEPLDGWENYDVYLANNLNAPEGSGEIKQSASGGEVELSFEVNRYGDPVNIKVVRSLCDKCDKEAIRLIKSGPKWKRKKSRGSVTVAF